MVVNGTLSSSEFYTAVSSFSELWGEFNTSFPHWSWLPSTKRPWAPLNPEDGYLSVEKVILPRSSEENHDKGDVINQDNCSSSIDDVELIDNATLVQRFSGDHFYDFHILYSASYKVPVLYFRAYCYDGQPLFLDDIEKDISVNSAELLTRSKWTFITQEEHPYLNRPWYVLHPCGTSEWMKLLLLNEPAVAEGRVRNEKYLVSWFSIVGQVFGLKIPFPMLDTSNTNLLQHLDK